MIKFVSFYRTGSLRFRGQQDEQRRNDFLNLEHQAISHRRRDKGLLRNMKLFSCPESFFSLNWTPGCWAIISFLYLGLIAALVNVIHTSVPKPMTLDDSAMIGDGSQR